MNMNGHCWLIFGLVIALVELSSANLKKERLITNFGGGECVDTEDCSNNGVCKPVDNGKGTCCCAVGFVGANCENKTAKDSLGSVVPATDAKGEGEKKEKKRTKLIKYAGDTEAKKAEGEEGSKRTLEYEKISNVVGLTPESLAEANQSFLIYNPSKELYLFVSKDYKITGKHNPYVEARGDREGERNVFLFKKVPNQDGKFHIFNVDREAYLYVSNSKSGFFGYWNNNVLASTDLPTVADQAKKYVFEFEDDDGDGFYTIKNQGKSFYVSAHFLGIPAYRLVKATEQKELRRWESRFFQFALRDKAKVTFSVSKEEKNVNPLTIVDGEQSTKVCYEDSKDKEPQGTSISYRESFKESRMYTRTNGFTLSAAAPLIDKAGKFIFTYKHESSTSDVSEEIRESQKTIALKVRPQTCACVEITFQSMDYTREFTLEAKTKEGKTIKAKGEIKGSRFSNFEGHTKVIDFEKDAKCPHEK